LQIGPQWDQVFSKREQQTLYLLFDLFVAGRRRTIVQLRPSLTEGAMPEHDEANAMTTKRADRLGERAAWFAIAVIYLGTAANAARMIWDLF